MEGADGVKREGIFGGKKKCAIKTFAFIGVSLEGVAHKKLGFASIISSNDYVSPSLLCEKRGPFRWSIWRF